MSVLMSKDRKELIVTCSCGCGQAYSICVDDSLQDDDYYAFLCFMKNNFQTEATMNPWKAFKIKMKKIWFILRGKDYCYSDTVMTKADFVELKEYINQFQISAPVDGFKALCEDGAKNPMSDQEVGEFVSSVRAARKQSFEEYIAGMKEYSKKVKTMSAEESKAALIRIGVLTPDGKPKENICDLGLSEQDKSSSSSVEVKRCYLVAKKVDERGCIAVQAEYGRELASLVDYLGRKTLKAGIEILTVSSKEVYGEYAPYKELSSEKEFICEVLSKI